MGRDVSHAHRVRTSLFLLHPTCTAAETTQEARASNTFANPANTVQVARAHLREGMRRTRRREEARVKCVAVRGDGSGEVQEPRLAHVVTVPPALPETTTGEGREHAPRIDAHVTWGSHVELRQPLCDTKQKQMVLDTRDVKFATGVSAAAGLQQAGRAMATTAARRRRPCPEMRARYGHLEHLLLGDLPLRIACALGLSLDRCVHALARPHGGRSGDVQRLVGSSLHTWKTHSLYARGSAACTWRRWCKRRRASWSSRRRGSPC
jgi:hypothetical protein